MLYVTRSIRIFFVLVIAITLPVAVALSQSGRGRPKIPQPSPTTSPPLPVSVPAATAVIKQEQAGTTSRFVLHNGITVVINEQHATPIVAAVACFKAATSDRREDGAAALIQHLILNGSAQGSALIKLRALGASVDVDASSGCAIYSLLVQPGKLKEALTIQADSLQNPKIDDIAISREAARVVEGAKLGYLREYGPASANPFTDRTLRTDKSNDAAIRLNSLDDPALYSTARLVDTAFGGVFANPPGADALQSITSEQLLELYRSRYRPDNLIMSIAGDVSTFETLVTIQRLYGSFGERAQAVDQNSKEEVEGKSSVHSVQKPRKDPSPANRSEAVKNSQPLESKPTPPDVEDRLRYTSERGDITQSIITVGFRVPGSVSKDSSAIEVLTALLGQGRGSRLNRSLIDQQMAANRVEAAYLTGQESGLLIIQIWWAGPREGASIDKAEAALFKVLDGVRRELPTEAELARAKTVLEKRHLDETVTYPGRATAIALAEADGSGFRSALDYRSRIRAVSAADVQRVAAAQLTISNTSINEYEPFSASARTFDSDTFAKTLISWAPGFAQPVESASVRAVPAGSPAPVTQGGERSPEQRALMESVQPLPIKDFSTLNGPKAFVREDHSQPNVTIAILFQGGRVTEDLSTSGTTELMLRSILCGTPRLTSSRINDELEQLGADVRIVVGPDFFGFTVSVLSRNAERALKLVRDEIEEPAFRDEDIVSARLGQIASIREAHDSSIVRAHELLLQALFPGHPYSLPPHGREEVVGTLNSDKVREWYSRVIKRQLPVAVIVGDTDGSALVSSAIAEGFRRREIDNVAQIKVPNFAKAAEKLEQRRTEHTALAIGVAGPKTEAVDSTAWQLIEAAMNPEGGRLLGDVRDEPRLISAGALDDEEMSAARVIWACALASPQNEQRTRASILAELEGLARSGMTTNELATAQALVATSQLALLQSQTQHALQYAREIFYRRQAADVDTIDAKTAKVSSDDIKRAASTYFKVAEASSGIVRGSATQPAPSPPKN